MANGNGNDLTLGMTGRMPSPIQVHRDPAQAGVAPRGTTPAMGGMQPGRTGAGPRGVNAQMGLGGQRLGPFAQAHQDAEQAADKFKTNMKALNVMDSLREELDDLMSKGDMVRPEEVIQSMGRLMGHESGVFGAEDTAKFLSDMPTMGGQGLATWIRMHDVSIRQVEAKLVQDTNFQQHRMGVTAIKAMAATTLMQEAQQRQARGLPGLPSPPQMPGGSGGPGMMAGPMMAGPGANAMMPPPGGGGMMAPGGGEDTSSG